uniref:Uncharacterized protein n=1 Tax=Dromaius novaehollandiae TaxID=8790 RepID=A0A8C4JD86_DRONO
MLALQGGFKEDSWGINMELKLDPGLIRELLQSLMDKCFWKCKGKPMNPSRTGERAKAQIIKDSQI